MEGWIKLHRKILNNEIWNDPTAFRLFILLLLNASHEDGRKINGIVLKRGQWIRSYSKLSEDLGYRVGRGVKNVSRSTVCRTIEKLKSFGMVAVDETDSGTLFTITNYQYYQGFASDEETNSGTVSGTKAEQRRNKGGTKAEPKQECKNVKNERMEEGINNKVEKLTFSDNAEETILTKLLVELMLRNNPNARIPKDEKQKHRWIDSLEKIHRLDGYSYEQIKKVIVWSQNNEFWKSNILSTKKLREKMPTLVLQMERNDRPQQSRYERTVSELDRLYQEALESEQDGSNQTH